MPALRLRVVFLSLYALGTLASALTPVHAPQAGTRPVETPALAVNAEASPQDPSDTAPATIPRPRRAARIDFTMPYYRFGRLPMRL